jgi:hypothetical protein
MAAVTVGQRRHRSGGGRDIEPGGAGVSRRAQVDAVMVNVVPLPSVVTGGRRRGVIRAAEQADAVEVAWSPVSVM